MSRQPLVLLVPSDLLTGTITAKSLITYGYDVVIAGSTEQAKIQLRTNPRISVLVVDTDLGPADESLSLAKDARVCDPDLKVIYTSHLPSRIGDREKVSGAPCLRTPYRPHQLVSVIGQLVRRPAAEEMEAYAA